ncbi:ABC transporter permease [Marinifilum caeruleilacunae]|jgi:ABC-2 type transport system permease protein|uniref:ABC transporter permease n=1 Tax=Marinifilum caeruleilacunae TaxID=2499076 RepID=A0ABX1WWI7_9BACT|nr:ABC transporter permease [Marinifilum caeruleilacunae]NOU60476.1 ABC transporter permease [Marinifilum caeruleilacunae]
MNKIFIIIQREYLSRVKKRSFLILTFLTPILIAGIYAFMIWMMLKDDTEKRTIAVLNESELVDPVTSSEFTTYEYLNNTTFDDVKQNMERNGYYAILVIPEDIHSSKTAELFSHKQVTIEVKSSVGRQIRQHIEKLKRSKIIAEANMPDLEEQLAATKTPISMRTIKFGEGGEIKQSSTEIAMGIGFAASFIIYMFIFLYGVQVMRGVIEEKSNRIVEVIISSVKPFQLMMGKIVGVAMVGLTQFIMWVVLTGIIITVGSALVLPGVDMETLQQAKSVAELPAGASSLDAGQLKLIQDIGGTFDLAYVAGIIGAFIFFFLGGYLLYSALFAAVGSAVDNETETQQFMLPITIPLILALYIGFAVARNPESSLAFWGSIIPFTSPIVMLVRIPFGVPIWELLVSMSILIGTFLLITWIAAKIYRTGILMYGKKVSYKEIWKWLRYHN